MTSTARRRVAAVLGPVLGLGLLGAAVAGLPTLSDVDGNGVKGALTDGLLFLRWLFGFTGATLTSGAVGMGCTRCDPTPILDYLSTLD